MNETFELVDLEKMLHGTPACNCELGWHRGACLLEAVNVLVCCESQFLACEVATHRALASIAEGIYCAGCYGLARDCWRVVPL